MKRGGPRWIVGLAIGLTLVVGSPAIVWICLPVSRSPGDVKISASPRRFLDNIYDVTIVNQGKTTLPREPITVGGHGTYVDYEPVLEAGEEVKTAFYLQDAAFLPPGLHRLTLYCTNCSTDIWVISFGDHMIAYK